MAEAKPLQELIQTLQRSRSYKVRLTAVLSLSKYKHPKAIMALRRVLKKRREHPYVKGFAALGLGRMKATGAIDELRRAARSRSRFVRNKARRALRILCPRSLRGKRYYVHLAKVSSSGPLHQYASDVMLKQVKSFLARRRDVTMMWPRCRLPRRWMLRRRRMKGFGIRMRLTMSYTGGKIRSKLSVLFTTFPGNAIKGAVSGAASAATSPSKGIVKRLVVAVTSSLSSDFDQFLKRR